MIQKTARGERGNAALPSPVHRPGKLHKPTCSRAEATVMGWRKQSSGSHQPQNPQHGPICCLQGIFLTEQGLSPESLTKEPTGVGFQVRSLILPLPHHYKQR